MSYKLSLYIHIPFCKSKCFYCSFTSFAKKDAFVEPYLIALQKEALQYQNTSVNPNFAIAKFARRADCLNPNGFKHARRGNTGKISIAKSGINTVFIGGGTPTYLNISQLEFLFSLIYLNFKVLKNAEITIEANPATFDLKKAKVLKKLGVNRVSLGVQSLNDKYLKLLGRPHNSKEALAGFEILRKAGFKNINLDLMYSLPGQSKDEIKQDVNVLTALKSEHISLYELSLEKKSKLCAKGVKLPEEEKQVEHYKVVVEALKKKGFNHYEVSNFSKKGFECGHNLNYWRCGNYIGLGVAAHSHFNGNRFWNTEDLKLYLEKIKKDGIVKSGEERLGVPERFMEALLIGLRLVDGVDVKKLEDRLKVRVPPGKKKLINNFIKQGFLIKDKKYLKTTFAGMMVLDEMCSKLI